MKYGFMHINFQVSIATQWGQEVYVQWLSSATSSADVVAEHKMNADSNGHWYLVQEMEPAKVYYRYVVKQHRSKDLLEYGNPRMIDLVEADMVIQLNDTYRWPDSAENYLFGAPFYKSFFKRNIDPNSLLFDQTTALQKGDLLFQLRAPRVGSDYHIGIIGDAPFLGEWNPDKVVKLSDLEYPFWTVRFSHVALNRKLEYKYVIIETVTGKIVTWEKGENRSIQGSSSEGNEETIVQSDEYFSYPVGQWKCAGLAIPIFSIRTENGVGVGEFGDIPVMVEWAVKTGMKIVQVLPVNDTVASHTWRDSYPYAAISVHALHPIYASMKLIGDLKDKKQQKNIDEVAKRLNALADLDYERVMKMKSKYFKLKFQEQRATLLISSELSDFVRSNKSWIIAYAVFSFFRDKFGTPDFNQWDEYRSMSDDQLEAFAAPDQPYYDDIAVHYFIQYHLDKQLKSATEYARNKGVVLKGDIPIGIYRSSVDAWRWPHLFNMNSQTGAPPDDFSTTGQNWGFPTYNWEAMAKENYAWWISRMVKMADYFDVFRIDHILGFFRIWEMDSDQVEGLLGRFYPSLSYTENDLKSAGIDFDFDRFCKPYITSEMISDLFGQNAAWVNENALNLRSDGRYDLKEEFSNQVKIDEYLNRNSKQLLKNNLLNPIFKQALYQLPTEVLFLADPRQPNAYEPRITLYQTYGFKALDNYTQRALMAVYNDFFFHRHNEFWRESAMRKLPMLKDATDMLICGEDLGMVPASVPGVMKELQILSLAIQRMPNDDRGFWNPKDIPYMYVTSTGSHDVSNLREWWLEDSAATQRFYNEILGHQGEAPEHCEPWVALEIIKQHLHSPAMLAIFPIQDLLAMSESLRRDDCREERINVPAIVPHYWKYRLHLNMEDLLKENQFNSNIFALMDSCGRRSDY